MAPRSNNPAEAVEHYRGRTVRLLSCLTSAHTTVSGYHAADHPHEVRQSTAGWHVEIVGYLYAIGYEDSELVSHHWHGAKPLRED